MSEEKNKQIKDLQQKVEQLEKENEELKKNQRYYKNGVFSLEYDKETLSDMVDDYKSKLEQLENIRKEAIEECKSVLGNPEHTIVSKNELMKIMLNILNK